MTKKLFKGTKETTVVAISDDSYCPSYLVLEHPQGADVCALVQAAAEEAVAHGIVCEDASQIPDRFFTAMGMTRIHAKSVEMPRILVRKAEVYEEAGIRFGRCQDCDSYDCGVCSYHGGKVDPTGTECTHLHGHELRQLIYRDKKKITYFYRYVIVPEGMDASKAAGLMNHRDFPDVQEFFAEHKGSIDPERFELVKRPYISGAP